MAPFLSDPNCSIPIGKPVATARSITTSSYVAEPWRSLSKSGLLQKEPTYVDLTKSKRTVPETRQGCAQGKATRTRSTARKRRLRLPNRGEGGALWQH